MIRRARIALGVACLLVLIVGATQSASGATKVQWIVFSAYPDGVPPAQLFRVQTNGEGLEQITKGKFTATDPTFAPDGKKIVFARLGWGSSSPTSTAAAPAGSPPGSRTSFPAGRPTARASLSCVKSGVSGASS